MQKILILSGLIQKIIVQRSLRYNLPEIMLIIVLLFTIAIMISAVLIGGLVATYLMLANYGIAKYLTIIIVAILTIFVIVALVFLTLWRINHFQKKHQAIFGQSSFVSNTLDTFRSFTDGFMAKAK
jgi:hypothetical protein